MRKPQITIIGDSQASEQALEQATALGKILARMDLTVITGGRTGIMEAVSKGVQEAGGVAVGILPGDQFEEANAYNTVVIPTGMGDSRNSLTVLAADVVIAIGGGAGTLTEMGFAWIYHKPILTLEGHGGWADNLKNKTLDQRRKDVIKACSSLDELKMVLSNVLKANKLNFKEV